MVFQFFTIIWLTDVTIDIGTEKLEILLNYMNKINNEFSATGKPSFKIIACSAIIYLHVESNPRRNFPWSKSFTYCVFFWSVRWNEVTPWIKTVVDFLLRAFKKKKKITIVFLVYTVYIIVRMHWNPSLLVWSTLSRTHA